MKVEESDMSANIFALVCLEYQMFRFCVRAVKDSAGYFFHSRIMALLD